MADPFADLIPATPDAPTTAGGRLYVSPAKPESNAFGDLIPKAGKAEKASDGAGKPDKGTLDAAAHGVAKGLTANFYDEIRGLTEASGTKADEPARLHDIILGAAKYWSGDPEAKTRYEEAVKREREQAKSADEQHPIASTIGEIGGALALPVGGAAGGATMLARVGKSAAVGAGYGALSGAGEGEGAADTASRATMGAALGGAAGGAAPVVLGGIEAAGRGIARAAEPIVNSIRGFADADTEAARRVVSAVRRDARNGDTGLTPAEFAGARAEGQPAAIMDMGGETTRALARSAANTSPEGRSVLTRTIDDRFEGQSGRVTDFLNRNFNYPNAHAQQQAIDQVEQTTNRAAYRRAYTAGDRDVMSPELERLLGAPAVGDAMRKAVENGKNRAVTQGFGAFNPAVTIENGMVRFNRKPNGAPAFPNIQLWDYTYRELRDAGQAAFRAGRNEEGGALSNLAQTMRGELDRLVPEYGRARSAAAGFFQAENALEAGQNFVAQTFNNRQAREAVARMTPTERQLFQDGFVSRYVESVERSPDRRSVLNKLANSPAEREKLEIALGRDRANEMETFLRVEGVMDLARGAVQGNSTTARQLIEAGLAGGVGYGATTGDWSPQSVFTAAFVGGLARGAASRVNQRIDQNVARRVADMLASDDPTMLRRGVAIVSRQPRMLNALRSADQSLARAASAEVPTGGVVQSLSPSRAEDNKPNVPGPSAQ